MVLLFVGVLRNLPIHAFRRNISTSLSDCDAVVVSVARIPICKIGGALATVSAPKLGAYAIKSAVEKSKIPGGRFEEAFIGNVISSGLGQSPARQAVNFAGLPDSVSCTTVNKVCASGMKSVIMSSLSIAAGYRDICIAGGMESMSNVPYYLPGARGGYRMGNKEVVDGLLRDGLMDAYDNIHMGICAEQSAIEYAITRDEQDEYAINSYQRSAETWKKGMYNAEVVPVPVKDRKETRLVTEDEEYTSMDITKIPTLKPVFRPGGTITAGNSSKLDDGASAMVVVSGRVCRELGLDPLFRIVGYGDAELQPVKFSEAPAAAVPKALKHAGVTAKDVEFHEINEAFAVVPLVTSRILGLDLSRVNVHGGAISLGHPLGSSGCSMIMRLYGILKDRDATIGCASICNGGGGASAIVIERLR